MMAMKTRNFISSFVPLTSAILAEVFQSNIEREDFFSIHLLFDQRQSSSSGVVSENP